MTSEARQYEHTCPDCKRVMQVEETDDLVRVVLPAPPPAAPCCERSASKGYTVTAAFITPGG